MNTLISFASALIGFGLGILTSWLWRNRMREEPPPPPFPHIDPNAPCPACGNRGCTIAFERPKNIVHRLCNTCGCDITQPPILPKLFEPK